MEMEKLVQIIVNEVMNRMKEVSKPKVKKVLFLEEESEKVKLKYSLFISDWEQIHFIDNEEKNDLNDYDLVICPKLNTTDLVDISNGRPSSEVSSIIIEAMFNGIKVICLEEGIYYRKFEKTCNTNFYQMMNEYEDKLLNFGIEIVKCSEIKNILSDDKYEKKDLVVNDRDNCYKNSSIDKKLITQSDIEKILNNNCNKIYVKKDSLITPLAKDYIRTNHLDLKRI